MQSLHDLRPANALVGTALEGEAHRAEPFRVRGTTTCTGRGGGNATWHLHARVSRLCVGTGQRARVGQSMAIASTYGVFAEERRASSEAPGSEPSANGEPTPAWLERACIII